MGVGGGKRVAHWRQIAVAACEQCGRNRIPVVHEPLALFAWLAARAGRAGILLSPTAASGVPALPAPVGALDVLIGPEGGFSEEERTRLVDLPNIVRLSLGPRILRADTAAAATVALWMAAAGDW